MCLISCPILIKSADDFPDYISTFPLSKHVSLSVTTTTTIQYIDNMNFDIKYLKAFLCIHRQSKELLTRDGFDGGKRGNKKSNCIKWYTG